MRLRAGIAIMVLAVVACGGDPEDSATTVATTSPADSTTTDQAGEAVGPDGGTVSSADGAVSVEVPPGALRESVNISLEPVDPASLGIDETDLAGATYDLRPSGLQFAQPAVIVRRRPSADFDVEESGIPVAIMIQHHAGTLTLLPTSTSLEDDELVFRAATSQFSENMLVTNMASAGEDGTIRLQPSSFTQEVGSTRSLSLVWDWLDDPNADITVDWVGNDSIEVGGGNLFGADATCAVVGDGTYVATTFGRGDLGEGTLAWFVWNLGMPVDQADDFMATVAGLATCTEKPGLAPEEIINIYDAEADFTPVVGGPSGPEFSAKLVFRITEQDGQLAVEIEQLPQGQIQEGWALLSDVVSFGVVGGGAGYTEGTAGWLIPDGPSFEIVALNWGGGVGEEDLFQMIIEDFFAAVPPTELLELAPADRLGALGQFGIDIIQPHSPTWMFTLGGRADPSESQ